MKDTKFRILLDIHEVRSQATIPVKVGDVSCKIYITLVEGGKPYKIHENSFGVFTGKKGDDNYIFNNCIVENGIIRYDFTPQTVAAAGVLECEIRIYDEDGGVLTTPSFNIVVDERAVNDSELASASEFAFLDEILVNEGQRIENERNRNEAFNNLGIDLEDDGEVISIVKTDIDGSQEKASFLKYADVIPPVTATATGSAITIDSSQAPIPYLKLSGKTTKNGDTLTSTGDSGSFEVGVYGGNLLSNTATNGNINGINTAVNADGSITISGTATTGFRLNQCIVDLKANTTYTLSCNEWQMYYGLNGDNNHHPLKGNVILSATQDCQLVVFKWIDEGSTYNETIYRQLEIGTQATPYKSFNKQTLTLADTLRSIPNTDIKDVKDFVKGVTTKKIAKRVLTENDNWMDAFAFALIDFDNHVVGEGNFINDRLPFKSGAQSLAGTDYAIGFNGSQEHKNFLYVSLPNDVVPIGDIVAFKTWIANNPITIYYEIEPMETPLTETELNAYRHLMTNKGNTTILSEADMEISYYVNKPNAQAIGSLHEQINKDYFKLQQAIISTGGN